MTDNGRLWYQRREDEALRKRVANIEGHFHEYPFHDTFRAYKDWIKESPFDGVRYPYPYPYTFPINKAYRKEEPMTKIEAKVKSEVKFTSEAMRIRSWEWNPGQPRKPYQYQAEPACFKVDFGLGESQNLQLELRGPDAERLYDTLGKSTAGLSTRRVKVTIEVVDP